MGEGKKDRMHPACDSVSLYTPSTAFFFGLSFPARYRLAYSSGTVPSSSLNSGAKAVPSVSADSHTQHKHIDLLNAHKFILRARQIAPKVGQFWARQCQFSYRVICLTGICRHAVC